MQNRWSDKEAVGYVAEFGERYGEDLALRTYGSRLLGADPELVLHGGGNTSVKTTHVDVLGNEVPALLIKGSGRDLKTIEPEGHCALDLERLRRLSQLEELDDDRMVNELFVSRFDALSGFPSIEALMHAFIDRKFVDHTHADAIVALTNRPDGAKLVREALGDEVAVCEYHKPGFTLAKAVAERFKTAADCRGMVLMKHGLVTWGNSARESYDATCELVYRAERYLAEKAARSDAGQSPISLEDARGRYLKVAPVLRGQLALPTGDPDRPFDRFVLRPLIDAEVLAVVDSPEGNKIAVSPPLTSDHLIRTKPLPMWVGRPEVDDPDKLKSQLEKAISAYAEAYEGYLERHAGRMSAGVRPFDSRPRVILIEGIGAICAGRNVKDADIAWDITFQTLKAKRLIAATGGNYEGLSEAHLFDMEYASFQRAKLSHEEPPLGGTVALVTGAAGAIGCGICEVLLKNGCHVAVTDLPGEHLNGAAEALGNEYGRRVIGVDLDVTDRKSVAAGFQSVVQTFGGVDLVVPNAGVAHVASLEEMEPEVFQRLQKINVEGTLNVLSEAARHFRIQGTGGDVVVISTKNVFAPGARFGAYSATKAASHQLARIASLELAEIGVRVNMVSPDAVFSHGGRRSGLWAEVGPDRMKARNLDEKGLEAYYHGRNLLKAAVTAEHVGRAVLYFATRQTPTTGATIPVDGGLPDSTPR